MILKRGSLLSFWLLLLLDFEVILSTKDVICPYPAGSPKCSGSPFIGFRTTFHQISNFGNTMNMPCEFSCCGNVSLSLLVNGKPFNRTATSFSVTSLSGYLHGEIHLLKLTRLYFEANSDSDQGFYTCVLSHGSKSLRSSKQGLYFADFSFAKLKYTISSINYTSEFKNTSSTSFKSAEALISAEVTQTLDSFQIAKRRVVAVDEITYHKVGIKASVLILQYAVNKEAHKKFCEKCYIQLNGPFNTFLVNSSETSIVDCCRKQTSGTTENRGITTWDYTPIDHSSFSETLSIPCPYHGVNDVKYASRTCHSSFSYGASWDSVNDGACLKLAQITSDSKTLSNAEVTSESILVISQKLMNLTEHNNNSTNATELSTNVAVMENILRSKKASNEVLDNLLTSASYLLNTKSSTLAAAQEAYNTSTRLLLTLDEVGRQYKVEHNDQGVSVPKKNIIFMAANVNTTIKQGAKFSLNSSSDQSSFQNLTTVFSRAFNLDISKEKLHETAFIPFGMLEQALENSSSISVKVYGYIYANDKLFTSQEYSAKESYKKNLSRVINLTIMNATVTNADNFIELRWPSAILNNNKMLCSFWNLTKEDWSQDGCSVKFSSSLQTVCQCNHLTNFALLFKYDDNGLSEVHKEALSIITLIGCGLSITCLFLTMITLVLFGKVQKLLPPKILIGLSVSLCATYFVFIFGVENSTNRTFCRVIAGALHYFVLSTFMWNAVEGLNLYFCFVTVYNNHVENFMIKACLFSHGIPFVVVAATAITRFKEDYSPGLYCIVTGRSFYVALLAPIAAIMTTNIIILARVMTSINKSLSINSKSSNIRKGKIWFSCACLLGLTWIFGVFTVTTSNIILQYLFCISASFQGLFLFLFHCILNRNIKAEVIRVLMDNIPGSIRRRMSKSNAVGCQTEKHFKIKNAVYNVNNLYDVTRRNTEASPNLSTVET